MTRATYMYNPKYKQNQILCGSGQIAICTGWTPKEVIARNLSTHEYAAIGQLYSTQGISFLFRNLIYNPHVRYLMILWATQEDSNAGSQECLLDFFDNGFEEGETEYGRKAWRIISKHRGYIDIEIDFKVLNKLRQALSVRWATNVKSAIAQVKSINEARQYLPDWGSPLEFAIAGYSSEVLPGPLYGHRVEANTIAETWIKVIERVRSTGRLRNSGYDCQVQELIDMIAVVKNEPHNFYFPEPNYLPCNRDFLKEYIPQVLNDQNKQDVKYTYGQRMRSWFGRDQIEQVIQKLIGEIDAASAVISLWDVKDHEKGGSPCLNHLWFRAIEGELSLTCTFRSHDAFGAWASNAFALRSLQMYVLDEIATRSCHVLHLGPLIVISQSCHLYDHSFEYADQAITKYYKKVISNYRNFTDVVGNFLIETEGREIHVFQTSPATLEVVREYKHKLPLALLRDITSNNPAIAPEHAGYLGVELQKASWAIANNKFYVQDKL